MTRLTVKDLALTKGKDVVILKGLNAVFETGKLNAIMGPNGCGKTTFLNILFGNSETEIRTSGKILLDGQERHEEEWFKDVSFVQQSSYIIKNQTVREYMQFALDMRNATMGTNKKLDEFNHLMEMLYLTKVMDSSIDVLSGGERKRAMIGLELVMMKKVLILDEPTSDLDSHLALNLIMLLKKMAEQMDILIIFTIHKPSDQMFRQFDNILFMKEGKTLYCGESNKMIDFLAEKGIVKPATWVATDFIFEAFYGKSHYKEINDSKDAVDSFLKDVRDKSEKVVSAASPSRKGAVSARNFTINFSKSFRLYTRFLSIAFKAKALIIKLLVIGTLPIIFYLISLTYTAFNKSEDYNPNLREEPGMLDILLGHIVPFENKISEFIEAKEKDKDTPDPFELDTNGKIIIDETYEMLNVKQHHAVSIFLNTVVFYPFAISCLDVGLTHMTDQIKAEVQKKFYSTSTLCLATLMAQTTLYMLPCAILTILISVTGNFFIIPNILKVIGFTFFLTGPIVHVVLELLFKAEGIIGVILSCLGFLIRTTVHYSLIASGYFGFAKTYLPVHIKEILRYILLITPILNPSHYINCFMIANFLESHVANEIKFFLKVTAKDYQANEEDRTESKKIFLFIVRFALPGNPFREPNVMLGKLLENYLFPLYYDKIFSKYLFLLAFVVAIFVCAFLMAFLFSAKFGTKAALKV